MQSAEQWDDSALVKSAAEKVRGMEQSHSTLDTAFTFTILEPREIASGAPWSEVPSISRRAVRSISASDRMRMEITDISDQPADDPALIRAAMASPDVIAIWDGSSWQERSVANNRVRYLRRPPASLNLDCIPMFNLSDGHTVVGGLALSTILRTCKLLCVDRQDSAVKYRFALDDAETNIIELLFATDEPLRLLSLTFDILRPDGAKELKLRIHYHVAEWAEYDGILLPKVAYRDSYSFARDIHRVKGIAPQKSRCILRRISARSQSLAAPAATLFAPLAQQGDLVHDERLNLMYNIGGDYIVVDGHRFKVAAPIGVGVEWQLSDVLGSSGAVSPQSVPIAEIIERRQGGTRTWKVVVGLIGITVIVVAYLLTRRRKHAV